MATGYKITKDSAVRLSQMAKNYTYSKTNKSDGLPKFRRKGGGASGDALPVGEYVGQFLGVSAVNAPLSLMFPILHEVF
jgi:hypothetical protein